MNLPAVGVLARDHLAVEPTLPDGFALNGTIDVGGQGAVHRGTFNGQPCALKVYFPGQLDTRIEREVEALRDLDSDYLVRLLWSGDISLGGENLPVVATEFIEGRTLADVVNVGAVPLDDLSQLTLDVTRAIDAMWEKRIVHRDLKPSNIMIRPDGRACVIDLGVARHLDQTTLTALGITWGTLGYMSPEQTRAVRQLTCKSDLFSLGVILLESALGRHPTGGDQLRLLASGFHRTLPVVLAQWQHAELLARLLAPKPILRPSPEAAIQILDPPNPANGGEAQ